MTPQGPISLEAIKLRLISDTTKSSNDPLLTRDGITYLLKALMYADAEFANEIEHVLVKAGSLAVPELVKALTHENLTVRSVSTMALIRLGQVAEEALINAAPKLLRKKSSRWIVEFIFQELNLPLTQVSERNPGLNGLKQVV